MKKHNKPREGRHATKKDKTKSLEARLQRVIEMASGMERDLADLRRQLMESPVGEEEVPDDKRHSE